MLQELLTKSLLKIGIDTILYFTKKRLKELFLITMELLKNLIKIEIIPKLHSPQMVKVMHMLRMKLVK